MSGLAEGFQKPHFQQANFFCLWHKKKGKIEAPKERLGTKPFIPPTACQGGRGREKTREEQRAWAFQTPPLHQEAESQQKTFRKGSTNLFVCYSHRERQISPQRKGQTGEMASTQRRSRSRARVLCPAVHDKGGRHSASNPGEGFPDPYSR